MQAQYYMRNDGYQHMSMDYVDEFDLPVKRTKSTHPYNYDGFVQERVHPNELSQHTVWSDRLLQWDYDKTRKLIFKHFKATGIDVGGDYYSSRTAEQIQGFLRDWYKNDKLEVTLVMDYCNQSNGYPLWRIDYRYKN